MASGAALSSCLCIHSAVVDYPSNEQSAVSFVQTLVMFG